MMTLTQITSDALKCQTPEVFSKYLESYFFEIEQYFNDLTLSELDTLKFDIEDFLYDLMDASLIGKTNSQIVNAFLLLLANTFEQANLLGVITIIFDYLPESKTKNRLAAAKMYLRVNDISKGYHNYFNKVMSLLNIDEKDDEEDVTPNIRAIENYFMIAMHHFSRVKNSELAQSFKKLFWQYKEQYIILNNQEIVALIEQVTIENYDEFLKQFRLKATAKSVDKVCLVSSHAIDKETGEYSQQLYSLTNPNFQTIRQLSFDYIKKLEDSNGLYEQLDRGRKIIDDQKLLYQYMVSFGQKHKEKLYDSYKIILDKIKDEKINIIDWGCGQAFATMILLNFAREKNITLNISNICLIEPSKIALERGLLHIDLLKQKEYAIKAINSDIDCIVQSDLIFDNDYKTLHLFSNILDMDSFKLNNDLLQNISSTFKNDNLFVCVSPNINNIRNNRLDLFYNYFNENFNTNLISSRDNDIKGHKRYEKLFEVIYIEQKEVIEVREEIKDYHVDVYEKLAKYADILEPTLNTNKLKENIENDPDYVIFKIRKVAEIITSKIFMNNGGEDESRVSQNDKIRYLSFEKKILSRKAQSHLHTIRTIGNIGTHDHIENPVKMLKDDAYFLSTALILLIEDLEENNII